MDVANQCSSCIVRSEATRKLKSDELEFYCCSKHEISVNQGEIIIKQTAPVTHMTYLKKGIVKIMSTGNNNNKTLFNLIKGPSFLGLSYFFINSNHIFSAYAGSSCEICFIEKSAFVQLVQNNGEFAKSVFKMEYINEVENYLWTIKMLHKSTPGRIADFLLYISTRFFDNQVFELPLNKNEIAELLGVSTKSFSRIFNEFVTDGLLCIKNNHVELTNLILLRKLSDMS